jgi:hypothetical protein
LLDNFESVLDAETANVSDAELDEAPHHALKIVLTTRIAPRAFN